jgi:hypothetical protein
MFFNHQQYRTAVKLQIKYSRISSHKQSIPKQLYPDWPYGINFFVSLKAQSVNSTVVYSKSVSVSVQSGTEIKADFDRCLILKSCHQK